MGSLLREIQERRAKRALDTRKVPEDVVRRIMAAATWAPSCFNNQPWRFIVIESEKALDTVKGYLADGNYWAQKSPFIVLAVTENELDCRLSDTRNYALFDVGLAVESLVLQAVKEGLVAHPIAGFKPVPIKKVLGIPGKYTLITLVILGYPGDESHLNEKHLELEHSERDRKPMEEVVMFNSWTLERPDNQD